MKSPRIKSRNELLQFAIKHGVRDAEQDLKKAECGAIYDNRDTGFGTTSWREHMGLDKYAINHFGSDLNAGRREYSEKIKVPNHEGRQWQKLMKNFNDAPQKIKDLESDISQLNEKHRREISDFMINNSPSTKEDIEKRINVNEANIRHLENTNEQLSDKIYINNTEISYLEESKNSIMKSINELRSKLQLNS